MREQLCAENRERCNGSDAATHEQTKKSSLKEQQTTGSTGNNIVTKPASMQQQVQQQAARKYLNPPASPSDSNSGAGKLTANGSTRSIKSDRKSKLKTK